MKLAEKLFKNSKMDQNEIINWFFKSDIRKFEPGPRLNSLSSSSSLYYLVLQSDLENQIFKFLCYIYCMLSIYIMSDLYIT